MLRQTPYCKHSVKEKLKKRETYLTDFWILFRVSKLGTSYNTRHFTGPWEWFFFGNEITFWAQAPCLILADPLGQALLGISNTPRSLGAAICKAKVSKVLWEFCENSASTISRLCWNMLSLPTFQVYAGSTAGHLQKMSCAREHRMSSACWSTK